KKLDDLQKDKKADKKAIKALQDALDKQGEKVKAELGEGMKAVRENYNDHSLKIEGYATECANGLKRSQDSLKKFEDAPNPLGGSDFDMATYAAGYIKTLVDLANKDADEYGKSWFEYRGFNGSGGYGVDAAFLKDFTTARMNLMNEQKTINTKINTME